MFVTPGERSDPGQGVVSHHPAMTDFSSEQLLNKMNLTQFIGKRMN